MFPKSVAQCAIDTNYWKKIKAFTNENIKRKGSDYYCAEILVCILSIEVSDVRIKYELSGDIRELFYWKVKRRKYVKFTINTVENKKGKNEHSV